MARPWTGRNPRRRTQAGERLPVRIRSHPAPRRAPHALVADDRQAFPQNLAGCIRCRFSAAQERMGTHDAGSNNAVLRGRDGTTFSR